VSPYLRASALRRAGPLPAPMARDCTSLPPACQSRRAAHSWRAGTARSLGDEDDEDDDEDEDDEDEGDWEGQPLITPRGRMRHTLRERPARWTTSTTRFTSL